MPVGDYFSLNYESSRQRFKAYASVRHARLFEYAHPALVSQSGNPLAIDVSVLEPKPSEGKDPESVFMIISGTHGVEGLAGSGCQVGFLADELFTSFPDQTRFILIHSLNPYGFAHLRRVNEDGVDLNRNFRDFTEELPSSDKYEELNDFLVPESWEGEKRKNADEAIKAYIQENGFPPFQEVVQGGQFTRPTGLFYGGTKPTWSNATFRRILHEHIPQSAKRVICFDIHTGLGPSGYGEPILLSSTDGLDRAKNWFGPEVKTPGKDQSSSAQISGSALENGFDEIGLAIELTGIALEFGTKPVPAVLEALRADHWLYSPANKDGLASALAATIRENLLDAFYTDTPAWKAAVYGRFADFVYRAARALRSIPKHEPSEKTRTT